MTQPVLLEGPVVVAAAPALAWPPPADAPPSPRPPADTRGRRRGPDPRWARPAVIVLLAATAGLYLWGLGASGWANSFYSAAVQAGTKSWKAFFFGSSDAAGSITVDKPPAALWVMELSARLFGVNAWSILVPQVLEGVAAVGLLYAAVRRWFGSAAGLLAGAILALTPVAALMFRYNNPDALLTLLLVGAGYATVRAIDSGHTKWLVTAGVLVGFGFITKMLQAFIVVPAFALAYLIAGPPRVLRRLWQLTLAGVALVAASLWWVVAVMAVPAADRPYIGGSQNNSLWNLIFGYNGFGRITGNETGSVGGAPGRTGQWGPTGLTRMFNASFGGQVSWLLPAALVLLVAGLLVTWRSRRTDRTRAALVVWGGWMVITALVFSLSKGIIHPYYTVALAPGIAATVAVGAAALWRHRHHWAARVALAAAVVATSWWATVLLGRTPAWLPWLHGAELPIGLAVATAIVAWPHLRGRVGVAIASAAVVVALAAPAAYTLNTVGTPHTGAIPSAGPAQLLGGPGGGFPGGAAGGFRRGAGGAGGAGAGGFAGGPPPGGFGRAGGGAAGAPPSGGGFGGFGGGGAGGPGGLLNGSTPSAALTQALEANSSKYEWVAATIGANEAAGYQLATGKSVMPIGGFNGTDPSPTLAQFEKLVGEGKVHYFIAGGGFGGPGGGGSSTSSAITSWVESHFTSETVGGATLYDLTAPVAQS